MTPSKLAEGCERAGCTPRVAREIVRWVSELPEGERAGLFRAVRGELRERDLSRGLEHSGVCPVAKLKGAES